VQCTKSAQRGDLFRHFIAAKRVIAECGPALFQPDIPQNTGTILRHQAGGVTGRRGAGLYAKRLLTYAPAMTKDQVKEVLDRVLTWPPERQEDAAQLFLHLEAHEGAPLSRKRRGMGGD
jgi:hypothetical protein